MLQRGFFFDSITGFACYKTNERDLQIMNAIAERDFSESNTLNHKTIYSRRNSRLAGILGELVFKRYMISKGLRAKYVARGGTPYDFIVTNTNGQELKVDVKCKMRKVPPQKSFDASFFTYQAGDKFKEVNFYVFMSTTKTFEYVWMCGLSTKKNWLDNPHGKLWRAGQVDPSNGMSFREDTWCVSYQYLTQFPQTM